MRDGYIIIENLVSREVMDELRAEAAPHLELMGRNSFEGERTQRIYGVPEKLRSADPFIEHPLVLAHLDRLGKPDQKGPEDIEGGKGKLVRMGWMAHQV